MTEVEIVREAHKWLEEKKDLSTEHNFRIDHITKFVQRLTGYTLWLGGEQPVPNMTMVQTIAGEGEIGTHPAMTFAWSVGTHPAMTLAWSERTLAYRVVKPAVDRSLRGWMIVTSGDVNVARHARCDGLYDGAGPDALRTWKWEELDGMTVRKLTEEDSDG